MSEYTLKFGSVSAMEKDKKNWLDLFEVYRDYDGEMVAFSKKTYKHGFDFEDTYKFEYKLCIKAESMASYLAEDEEGYNDIHFELFIVPLTKYLNSKIKNEIADCMCEEEIDLYDIVSYGGCPYLDRDCLTLDNNADFDCVTENKEVVKMLDACATTCETTNNLRGFYLDRTWNMIGNTGWDLLDNMINGEDYVTKAFDRYKDSLKG